MQHTNLMFYVMLKNYLNKNTNGQISKSIPNGQSKISYKSFIFHES